MKFEYPDVKFDSPEDARVWLREILGPRTKVLDGREKEMTWTMLLLTEPVSSSNNQQTITDKYIVAGREFWHTTGDGIDILEEVIEDDFQ